MEINEKKEQKTKFTKKVGLAEWRVLKFNPTHHELNKILGNEDTTDEKEITYGSRSDNGKDAIRISAWLQEVKTGYKTPVTFFLEDDDVISEASRKTQYVNAVGKTSYTDSEENLAEWFKKAMTYRKARKGEAELMEFLRNWLQDIELNLEKGGSRNNILLDMSKIFTGNVKELNDLVTSEYAGTIVCDATVRSKKTEDGTKFYQSVYNRRFLPGYCIKYFEGPIKNTPKFVSDFVDEMKGKYGPKDYFSMDLMRDYVEGENPVDTDAAVLRPETPNY